MVSLNANLIFVAGGSAITTIQEQGAQLYFVKQQGQIYRQSLGLFLDIQAQVLYPGFSEIGLLALAFHPDGQRFYLWYSEEPNVPPPGFDHINRLEEWRIIAGVPQKTVVLLRLPNPTTVHNGVNNIFYDVSANRLILATGDGGNNVFAQQDDSLFGKLISINVDDPIWLSMENTTPVTQPSQLGVFASVITVISKGIRNPSKLNTKGGYKFMSVAGQNNREFAFAFVTYNKNFGWRPFEGPNPTVNGTTMLYPTEVNQLLYQNTKWLPVVSYANPASVGLTPEVIRGPAITGIDYYQGSIPGLNSNFIVTDLSNQVFNALAPPNVPESLLQISQFLNRITVTGSTGSLTTMYITNFGSKILIATVVTGAAVTARIYELKL